jgi:hypothetical protein
MNVLCRTLTYLQQLSPQDACTQSKSLPLQPSSPSLQPKPTSDECACTDLCQKLAAIKSSVETSECNYYCCPHDSTTAALLLLPTALAAALLQVKPPPSAAAHLLPLHTGVLVNYNKLLSSWCQHALGPAAAQPLPSSSSSSCYPIKHSINHSINVIGPAVAITCLVTVDVIFVTFWQVVPAGP